MSNVIFFYKKHRQRFIVVFHKEFENFNVAKMRFKNFVLYVQRKMNEFLRLYRYFARCYINNIIIFSRIAKKHFQHLKTIFALFTHLKIILKSKNLYLNYLLIILFQ